MQGATIRDLVMKIIMSGGAITSVSLSAVCIISPD